MAIKSIARGPWGDNPELNTTWYRHFTETEWIRRRIYFSRSQPITGICTVADVSLLPYVIEAGEDFSALTSSEQADLVSLAGEFEQLFLSEEHG